MSPPALPFACRRRSLLLSSSFMSLRRCLPSPLASLRMPCRSPSFAIHRSLVVRHSQISACLSFISFCVPSLFADLCRLFRRSSSFTCRPLLRCPLQAFNRMLFGDEVGRLFKMLCSRRCFLFCIY